MIRNLGRAALKVAVETEHALSPVPKPPSPLH
jgi:hypothetical protein